MYQLSFVKFVQWVIVFATILIFISVIGLMVFGRPDKTGIREFTENGISCDIMADGPHGKYKLVRVVYDYKVHTLVETPSGAVKIAENATSEKGW